jgi:hypothetical protein
MALHKDSNLGRCRFVPKMLMGRLDNMDPLRRSARNGLALGPESIT